MRDAAQCELDRVDCLVHHHVAEIELQQQTSITQTTELLSHLAAAMTTVTASVAPSSLLVMDHFSIVVVHIRSNTLQRNTLAISATIISRALSRI